MGQVFPEIDERNAAFIRKQKMFFVATAPLAQDGLVNLSPKGLDSFAILDPLTVAYLDLMGSGIETVAHLRERGLTRMEATPEAGASWTQHMADLAAGTLLPQAESWYMGANIPGKPRQLLHHLGVQEYLAACRESAAKGYAGFALR